jgi:hypothetical protein
MEKRRIAVRHAGVISALAGVARQKWGGDEYSLMYLGSRFLGWAEASRGLGGE